jgi:dihydroxyacetone kinase
MSRLFNIPSAFADELTEGFVAANRNWVLPVPGGVVRSTRSENPTVAIVTGGGSGHYPAFGGLVGQGLVHGAAMGNLFASPSAQQVYSVAKAAHQGLGVLLTYGNYAGDVLHFTQAQERLLAEGIPCQTVVVTDDIASASVDEITKRRGIAGDLAVFKAASAAAESGYSLDDVVRVAQKANALTRSFGVAFGGCTLPGATEPLFTVPEGRMALGLGIHGEPGIGETDIPTADGLAELFVEKVLGELPDGVSDVRGSKAAVILNGLGSVKYEELFVVYRRIAQLLDEVGIEAIDPEVGELVTSFDMAGVSFTISWLDDELEGFWRAPADAPGYRKGSVAPAQRLVASEVIDDDAVSIPDASAESQDAARTIVAAIQSMASVIDLHAEELGRIDAVAGDGDHGIGMQRGVTAAAAAAVEAQAQGAGAGTVLIRASDAWAHRAGGTSGALWGVALRAIGTAIGDELAPNGTSVAAGVQAARDGIMRFGKAEVGDKTMVDVLVPFAEILHREVDGGRSLRESWATAADVATSAAESTAHLLPRMGRARPHAEKSLGTVDAGAYSLALLTHAVSDVLAAQTVKETTP